MAVLPNHLPGLNFCLGENADMLRSTVEAFAADEIAPRAGAIDRDNAFPGDLWAKMGALGVLGVTVSEEFGGAGMGYLEHVVAMEEISRASASVGLKCVWGALEFVREPDLSEWQRRAAAAVSAGADRRVGRGGAGDERAGGGVGCGGDAHAGGQAGRAVFPQRVEDVDH